MQLTREFGTAKVWDRLVRIGHWLLVILVMLSWLTRHSGMAVHEAVGYAALGVVGVRIAWGFYGSRYARFKEFVRSPAATLAYARDVASGEAPRYLGHNPLGGWMILALLVTTLSICLSGWLYTTDAYWGVEWVANLHESLTYVLISLIALHVAGVAFSSWRHRENLVVAMFTGMKRNDDDKSR
jgi:cytochrome b